MEVVRVASTVYRVTKKNEKNSDHHRHMPYTLPDASHILFTGTSIGQQRW